MVVNYVCEKRKVIESLLYARLLDTCMEFVHVDVFKLTVCFFKLPNHWIMMAEVAFHL